MNPDVRLGRFGAKRFGIVTWDQCLAAGFTPRQVERRIAAGHLTRLYRGVYRLASVAPCYEGDVLAACFATSGVASHRAAAALYGLRGFEYAGLEITVPRSRWRPLPDVTIHRRDLGPWEVARRGPLRITTPASTLLDIAGVAPDLVEAALDDALLRRLTRLALVGIVLHRSGGRGRAGTAVLGRLVDERDEGQAPTMSELEDQFLALVRRFGLPEPVRQYRLAVLGDELTVDFAYPPPKVAIELDGRRWHGSRCDARRDRQRDRLVRAAGWEPVRICKDDMDEEPEAVAADIARLLLRRAA
jgi:very-short-patch-repair endonuclease